MGAAKKEQRRYPQPPSMGSRSSFNPETQPARLRGQKEQHGLCRHPLYKVWVNVLDRCLNPASPHYHNYGARGITVHPRLMSFPQFLDAVGERPTPLHQLDRVDNDQGYQPGNLRWLTKKEQAHNMRKNHLLTVGGETKTLTAWADQMNLAPSTIHYRLSKGMSEDQAVLTPARVNGRR